MDQKSFLYVVQQVNDGPLKVGISNDPAQRLIQLQVGNPDLITILGRYEGTRINVEIAEKRIHHILRRHRLSGEWFKPVPFVVDYLKSLESDGDKIFSNMKDAWELHWGECGMSYNHILEFVRNQKERGDYDIVECALAELAELMVDIGGEGAIDWVVNRRNGNG